jgi:beta-lactamase class A
VPSSVGAAPVCVEQGGWACPWPDRFARVTGYLDGKLGGHGYLGVVFLDRVTGRRWSFGATDRPGWTASTVKLAIAADLLVRQRAGQLQLTPADRRDMDTMLNYSDEAASDRLWRRFGGADMLERFRTRFGMTSLRFVPGFTQRPYWGYVKCSTDDLSALLSHLFTDLAPAELDYLVSALRGVAPNQRWGIWAAGPDQRPGNKDGWSQESDSYGRHWVANTVGFAGPGERYLVAVTYQVDPGGSLDDGVHVVSDVVALLFGRPVPAPVTVPAPDG